MEDKDKKDSNWNVSRRNFIKTVGGGLIASTALPPTELLKPVSATEKDQVLGPDRVKLELLVNGKKEVVEVETRTTLAEALREKLNLTGTKVVCDRGSCGGCTVVMNGETVCACMTLACDAAGQQVSTIEGLANGEKLHPIQECFIEADALQCGFCTPGMVMSCKALIDKNANPTVDDVRYATSGNLCRCGTYPHVFEATLAAAKKIRSKA